MDRLREYYDSVAEEERRRIHSGYQNAAANRRSSGTSHTAGPYVKMFSTRSSSESSSPSNDLVDQEGPTSELGTSNDLNIEAPNGVNVITRVRRVHSPIRHKSQHLSNARDSNRDQDEDEDFLEELEVMVSPTRRHRGEEQRHEEASYFKESARVLALEKESLQRQLRQADAHRLQAEQKHSLASTEALAATQEREKGATAAIHQLELQLLERDNRIWQLSQGANQANEEQAATAAQAYLLVQQAKASAGAAVSVTTSLFAVEAAEAAGRNTLVTDMVLHWMALTSQLSREVAFWATGDLMQTREGLIHQQYSECSQLFKAFHELAAYQGLEDQMLMNTSLSCWQTEELELEARVTLSSAADYTRNLLCDSFNRHSNQLDHCTRSHRLALKEVTLEADVKVREAARVAESQMAALLDRNKGLQAVELAEVAARQQLQYDRCAFMSSMTGYWISIAGDLAAEAKSVRRRFEVRLQDLQTEVDLLTTRLSQSPPPELHSSQHISNPLLVYTHAQMDQAVASAGFDLKSEYNRQLNALNRQHQLEAERWFSEVDGLRRDTEIRLLDKEMEIKKLQREVMAVSDGSSDATKELKSNFSKHMGGIAKEQLQQLQILETQTRREVLEKSFMECAAAISHEGQRAAQASLALAVARAELAEAHALHSRLREDYADRSMAHESEHRRHIAASREEVEGQLADLETLHATEVNAMVKEISRLRQAVKEGIEQLAAIEDCIRHAEAEREFCKGRVIAVEREASIALEQQAEAFNERQRAAEKQLAEASANAAKIEKAHEAKLEAVRAQLKAENDLARGGAHLEVQRFQRDVQAATAQTIEVERDYRRQIANIRAENEAELGRLARMHEEQFSAAEEEMASLRKQLADAKAMIVTTAITPLYNYPKEGMITSPRRYVSPTREDMATSPIRFRPLPGSGKALPSDVSAASVGDFAAARVMEEDPASIATEARLAKAQQDARSAKARLATCLDMMCELEVAVETLNRRVQHQNSNPVMALPLPAPAAFSSLNLSSGTAPFQPQPQLATSTDVQQLSMAIADAIRTLKIEDAATAVTTRRVDGTHGTQRELFIGVNSPHGPASTTPSSNADADAAYYWRSRCGTLEASLLDAVAQVDIHWTTISTLKREVADVTAALQAERASTTDTISRALAACPRCEQLKMTIAVMEATHQERVARAESKLGLGDDSLVSGRLMVSAYNSPSRSAPSPSRGGRAADPIHQPQPLRAKPHPYLSAHPTRAQRFAAMATELNRTNDFVADTVALTTRIATATAGRLATSSRTGSAANTVAEEIVTRSSPMLRLDPARSKSPPVGPQIRWGSAENLAMARSGTVSPQVAEVEMDMSHIAPTDLHHSGFQQPPSRPPLQRTMVSQDTSAIARPHPFPVSEAVARRYPESFLRSIHER